MITQPNLRHQNIHFLNNWLVLADIRKHWHWLCNRDNNFMENLYYFFCKMMIKYPVKWKMISQVPQPNEYANLHLYLYISTHTCISYIHVSTSSFSFRTDLQMETSISRITSKHNFYIISIQSIKFALNPHKIPSPHANINDPLVLKLNITTVGLLYVVQ